MPRTPRGPTRAASKPRRWQIREVDLNPAEGHEPQGVRACLVISLDALNQSDFGTVKVCPITTGYRESFTWRPGLVPDDLDVVAGDWEAKPNRVATDQIATIDVQLGMIRHLATLTDQQERRTISDSVRPGGSAPAAWRRTATGSASRSSGSRSWGSSPA